MIAQHETIVDRIRADHRLALERIAELEGGAQGGRASAAHPVYAPMRTDLLAHLAAEEEYVYLLLRREMRQWIENSMQEHARIRKHLAALEGGSGASATAWPDCLRKMKQVLEQHIADEEQAVLPQLEMDHDLEKLRDLGDEYERRKQESL